MKFGNILYSFLMLNLWITAEHSSIYNTASSSNAIYNSYNLFTQDSAFSGELNGIQDNLDVEQFATQSSTQNNRGHSALQTAILSNASTTDIEKLLQQNDGFVDFQDRDGRTALHYAALYNNLPIVELLLQSGANTNISDHQGWTPLMVAVNANSFTTIHLLLQYQAQCSIVNFEDKKAIDYAHNNRIVLILKEQCND